MFNNKFSDFELLEYYVRRKEVFPFWATKAFEVVFVKYFKNLSSYAIDLSIDEYTAIVNETFLIILENIANGKQIDNLESTIKGIFMRVLRKNADNKSNYISIEEYNEYFENMTENVADTFETHLDIDFDSLIKSVLSDKTEIEILKLFSSGYTSKEIANLLNKKVLFVNEAKKQAITKLRNSLKKDNIIE